MSDTFYLNGEGSLTVGDVVRLARNPSANFQLSKDGEGFARMKRTATYIQDAVAIGQKHINDTDEGERRRHLIYGVTTGFGHNKNKPLECLDSARKLQRNLIISHAAGVGSNTDEHDLSNYFSAEIVRALLLIRASMFLQGYSGVRPELAQAQIELLNHNIIPLIPKKGSVGSSGDLAPLAHLALVLIGEGHALVDGEIVDGKTALKKAGLEPYDPTYKEGLALTNGTTVSLAISLFVVHEAKKLLLAADTLTGMSLEAILGPTRALEPFVHKLRHHPGQIQSAQNTRRVIEASKLINKSGEVQSLYSTRCSPQVHGAAHDTWRHCASVIERELNAVTDNPLFDPDLDISTTIDGGELCAFNAFSAGNFHGEPLGFAMDFLAIAMAEVTSMSERRIQMLLDAHHNGDLPQDLIPGHGLNSGFMILQYTAAALTSENKVLCHPASVDSIPTSSNAEDHVAMSPHAARKAREVANNAFSVLGIELLAVTQALCFRTGRVDWPKAIQASNPLTVADADLGKGTRAGFAAALKALGDDGQEFEPFEKDERVPAPYARKARALLEADFVDQVSKGCQGLHCLPE
ncbi:MAG: aromatic amino acid ammonia-lyase [Planctomycetota bacterium]|nr:aromatic amino acid ammonia-lyase [Planctomycetota bacterium]